MTAFPQDTASHDADIRPAGPEDIGPALDMLLAAQTSRQASTLGPCERLAMHDHLVREIVPGDDASPGLFVAVEGGHVIAAVSLTERPGRVLQMSVPVVAAEENRTVVAPLLDAALDSPRVRAARLVQVLSQPDRQFEHLALVSAGFEQGSELLYLLCPQTTLTGDGCASEASRDVQNADTVARLEFATIDPLQVEPRHQRLIAATYEGSLDCPALAGARDIDDEIASYRGADEFVHRDWFVVRHNARDIGCLLLAAQADTRFWEIVYVGLIPDVRGRGWGRRLVRKAMDVAAAAGARGIVLGVDANNRPAVNMYGACGFVRWERRLVYLFVPT
ncbi:MAG: GNAT family N-acetyltransferase [Planctomycetales bacterium]|nr:GNAT family N-acetyltransferase [Planctomycetales bacterium]